MNPTIYLKKCCRCKEITDHLISQSNRRKGIKLRCLKCQHTCERYCRNLKNYKLKLYYNNHFIYNNHFKNLKMSLIDKSTEKENLVLLIKKGIELLCEPGYTGPSCSRLVRLGPGWQSSLPPSSLPTGAGGAFLPPSCCLPLG